MYSLTFIRDRIFSPASTHVRPATTQSHLAGPNQQVVASGHSGRSHLQPGPDFGWPANAERLAPAPGAEARQKADPPPTGVAAVTSALTSFTTRLVDSKITG